MTFSTSVNFRITKEEKDLTDKIKIEKHLSQHEIYKIGLKEAGKGLK